MSLKITLKLNSLEIDTTRQEKLKYITKLDGQKPVLRETLRTNHSH